MLRSSPETKAEGADTIERGHIHFFYRPVSFPCPLVIPLSSHAPQQRVDDEHVTAAFHVQRLHLILVPATGLSAGTARLITVSSEALPEPARVGNRTYVALNPDGAPADRSQSTWAFVDRAGKSLRTVMEPLYTRTYETATRGTRTLHTARPCGSGVYAVVVEDGFTHLCYELRLPGKVQHDLNIQVKGSFIVCVKSPSVPKLAPGLDAERADHWPEEMLRHFVGRTFAPAHPTSLLDHEGAQLMLVACSEGKFDAAERQSGIEDWEAEEWKRIRALKDRQRIFKELELQTDEFAADPLVQGEWA
ncbi:hypothetical protein HK101_000963 [Irineochytrium annulatum]|nr:hypothetical protein HK101_000963 [Irineochytrium annulatum]